jgi:serine/threonine-protein kinase RsbW
MSTHIPFRSTGQSDTIMIDLPASHRYLNVLEESINAMLERTEGIADLATLSYAVQLAVHEACTNIIEHAYGGEEAGARIRVEVRLQGGKTPEKIIIELRDTGTLFNPATVPAPNLDEPHEHGYGLFLMHNLMDEIAFTSDSQGNVCRMSKRLN